MITDFKFIPSNSEQKSQYHEMFKEEGLDVRWDDLGIDATIKNTYNVLEVEDGGNGNVIDHIMYNPSMAEAIEGSIIEMERPLSGHKPVWGLMRLKPE